MTLRVLVTARNELYLYGLLAMLNQLQCVERTWGTTEIANAQRFLAVEGIDACLLSGRFRPNDLAPLVDDMRHMRVKSFLVASRLSQREKIHDAEFLDERDLSVERLEKLLAVLDQNPCAKNEVRLTEREREVLERLYDGLGNKQIAHSMGISVHGVKQHVSRILAKLNCTNRTAAVTRALDLGFNLGHPLRVYDAGHH